MWTEQADLAALNGLQIVDALANNDAALLAAIRDNPIHNPTHSVWQRGTSFASGASQFTSDRHKFRRGANAAGATLTRQSGLSMPNPTFFAAQATRNPGNTDVNAIYHCHQIESADAAWLAGKSVYLVVDAQCGANFSEANGKLFCNLYTGTGTNETVSEATGFATGNTTFNGGVAISTTPGTLAFGPFAIPANATEIAFSLYYTPVGTAGAADWFRVTNERLVTEAQFSFSQRPYPLEFQICRRFYQPIQSGVARGILGARRTSTLLEVPTQLDGQMFAAPSLVHSSPTFVAGSPSGNQVGFFNVTASAYMSISGALTVAMVSAGNDFVTISLTPGTSFSGGANGDVGYFLVGAGAKIAFEAEI